MVSNIGRNAINTVPRRIEHFKCTYPSLFEEPVLDVGCGVNVTHLRFFSKQSIGIDGAAVVPPEGMSFVRWNFSDDIGSLLLESNLPDTFNHVWCQDVFEHVLTPHEFLLNLRRVLKPAGTLYLGVPLVTALGNFSAGRNSFLNYFQGFLSSDHVNFFTYKTLIYTVEYAGFKVIDWYSPFLVGRKKPFLLGIEPVTVLVLRKVSDFQYGPKAAKELKDGRLQWRGFIASDQSN